MIATATGCYGTTLMEHKSNWYMWVQKWKNLNIHSQHDIVYLVVLWNSDGSIHLAFHIMAEGLSIEMAWSNNTKV